MKKQVYQKIKKELSRLINRKGMGLEKYYATELRTSKLNITYDELLEIIKEDNSFTISKIGNNDIVKIDEDFYKSKEYYSFEDQIYNWNYTKTLFREQLNLNILLIYKLIRDLGEVNYAEISNHLKRLKDINLDIKQLSHYCKEIKLMNLISSYANLNISNEKFVKLKTVEYENLSKKEIFAEHYMSLDEMSKESNKI